MDESQIRAIVQSEVHNFFASNLVQLPDRTVSQKHLQILDARNIQVGKTNGTQIGTESTQKLGFYGVTPIVQQSAISGPSGGTTVDSAARTAINTIIAALKNIGITQ